MSKRVLLKSEKMEGFRKCTSWQSLKVSIKENGYENTHCTTGQLIKNTKDGEDLSYHNRLESYWLRLGIKFKRQIE